MQKKIFKLGDFKINMEFWTMEIKKNVDKNFSIKTFVHFPS